MKMKQQRSEREWIYRVNERKRETEKHTNNGAKQDRQLLSLTTSQLAAISLFRHQTLA